MSQISVLDFDTLLDAVDRGYSAIRSVTRLQPAGGPGDKVFPPTYAKEDRAVTKYATENRRVDGKEVACVLLDSVASQANRMEQALLEAWRRDQLRFPLARVDFSNEEGLTDLGEITTLDAPHRIADAIFRDSVLDGEPFRHSTVGQAITDAHVTHATAMYRYCPTALIFGVWDSTGPKGGGGSKFQRALVSEIVGVDAVLGVKTASRIDPLQIVSKVSIYQRKDDSTDWTLNGDEAAKSKAKPVLFSRTKKGKAGSPSAINHSNIPPTMDTEAGGVTVAYALQTTVLSLPALRRLRFATAIDGSPLPPERRHAAETAARTNLAALALCAIVHGRETGYDLRSRALLVPDSPLVLELLSAAGGEPRRFQLSTADARALQARSDSHAAEFGLGWPTEPVTLQPSAKLAALVRESRRLASEGQEIDE